MSTINEVRAMAAKVNAARDQYRSNLDEVEKLLVETKIGVMANVPISSDKVKKLLFMKYNGRWGLYATSNDGPQPLTAMPATTRRMITSDVLRALLSALVDEAAKELVEIQDATRDLEEYLGAIRASK